jgi:spermidine/putrescine transport system substrate-binding protein
MNVIKIKLIDRCVIRCVIIFFWLAIIIGVLYIPTIHVDGLHTKKSINVLTWPDLVDREMIARFEQETGITVNFSYFESNDEVVTKLGLTDGGGYDLVTVTDYGVNILRERGLLQQIDAAKLTFWSSIESRLLNHYFDPQSRYAIPYVWDVYGIGINKQHFKNKLPAPTWALIFDPSLAPYHMTMIDEETELVRIAAQYLYGNPDDLNDIQLESIKKLFIQQRPKVEVYSEMRGDYLLASGTSPLAITQSGYIWQAMQQNEHIDFLIPREGSFMVIDTMVIPKQSTQQELVYQFINFLYQEELIMRMYKAYGFLPALRPLLEKLDLGYLGGLSYILDSERFSQIQFFKRFKRTEDQEKISAMWIDIKSY